MKTQNEKKKKQVILFGVCMCVCVIGKLIICFLQPCLQVDKLWLYVTDS